MREIYKKYFIEKKIIPEGNFIEVKYEDFISNPLKEMKNIYESLDIVDFRDSERSFNAYILSQSKVKLRNYILNDDLKDKIYSRWGFVFNEFGYDR